MNEFAMPSSLERAVASFASMLQQLQGDRHRHDRIWFADEARIAQKNMITRRWAKRGTRPSARRDQRTASTYIFGAVCPKEGKGAALILPTCNTEAMNLQLVEIAATVAFGAHAVLLVDQAGWPLSTGLVVPPNLTIMALPPKCPELNPVESGSSCVTTGCRTASSILDFKPAPRLEQVGDKRQTEHGKHRD